MNGDRDRNATSGIPMRAWAALAAIAMACALPATLSRAQPARYDPTPGQTEGPFYPTTLPADRDSDLTQVVGRSASAKGTRLYFGGRVLARDGRPLAGAMVELWQCDAFGRYHGAGDEGEPRDDDFQGYGVATTDGDGRFAFKTLRPVAYGGRPPHLHLKLRATGAAALTTQLYISGDRTRGDPVLAGAPKGTLERLSMILAPVAGREPGALAGAFDFVLQ